MEKLSSKQQVPNLNKLNSTSQLKNKPTVISKITTDYNKKFPLGFGKTNVAQVSFGYKASPTTLRRIVTSLTGRLKTETAPNFFLSPETESSLLQFIKTPSSPPDEALKRAITAKNQEVHNHYALASGYNPDPAKCKPLKKVEEVMDSTEQFFTNLKKQMEDLNQTMNQVGLSKEEQDIFHLFVAKTAPMLEAMGYPNAITHSGQVARKCMTVSYFEDASSVEILKSAMTGWLHDPKLPSNVSWSNMAVHPTIGRAIAEEVFSAPEFKQLTTPYLTKQGLSPDNFIKGAEALGLNDDSEFVTRNAILHKPSFSLGNPEPGVADRIQDPEVERIAIQRIQAASKGEKPEQFSAELANKIQNTSFETGIKTINKNAFETIVDELRPHYPAELEGQSPEAVYKSLIKGEITNTNLITAVQKALKEKPNAVDSPRIDGLSLFAHHAEVCKEGKAAAYALANSDALLLSFDKLAEQTNYKNLKAVLGPFFDDINKNVNNLPRKGQYLGRIWQRDMYVSIIRALDKILGTNHYKPSMMISDEDIIVQIRKLEEFLQNPQNWGDEAVLTITDKTGPEFQKYIKHLREQYGLAAENSFGMFKVPLT